MDQQGKFLSLDCHQVLRSHIALTLLPQAIHIARWDRLGQDKEGDKGMLVTSCWNISRLNFAFLSHAPKCRQQLANNNIIKWTLHNSTYSWRVSSTKLCCYVFGNFLGYQIKTNQDFDLKWINWSCNFWLICTSCKLGNVKPYPTWRPDYSGLEYWAAATNLDQPGFGWAAKGKIAVTASWEGRHSRTPRPWHQSQMLFRSIVSSNNKGANWTWVRSIMWQ